jgi:modulator of FtsH protease
MNDYKDQRYNQSSPWGEQNNSWGGLQAPTAAEVSISERLGFIRKVYALFFIATLFAIGGVVFGMNSPTVLNFAFEHPFMMFLLMLGGVFGAQAVRHVRGLNLVALFAFTTFTGIVISPAIAIAKMYNPASIIQAGFLTVGIFGGLTAYVFVTKKDFSFMRGLITTGLIVVVLAGLLNFFILGSSALGFGVAAIALLVFSGFVLYDTSNIIHHYSTNEYVAGALSLYLDAFNIFLALLRLLNSRD